MKKTKLRLRKWVKVTLAIILLFIILTLILMEGTREFNDVAKLCDQEKGYTCSYYEVKNFRINK